MARQGGTGGPAANGEDEGMTVALIDALGHPLRREILRRLNESDGARSASQLGEVLDQEVTSVSYHMGVLAKLRAIKKTRSRQVRGARESFFVSKVAGNERVVAVLADTEGEDGEVRR